MMRTHPAYLLLLILFPAFTAAQSYDRIEHAIEYLELEEAGRLALSTQETKYRLYYQARIVFLKYLVSESPDLPKRFLDLSKSSIHALNKLPDSDPQKNVLIAELFFLRGAVKALEKRYVGSAVDIKSACNLIYRNYRAFPDNPDQLKLMGIFHVAMSAIPKKLKWLGNVLCFKGDLDTGMRQLEEASKNSKLLPNEASVLLFYFEKNLLDDPDAANRRTRALHAQHPESIIYNYLQLSSYLEQRENDKALALCGEWERKAGPGGSKALPILSYACGKAHFFKLDYAGAIRYFDRFLDLYQGKTLYADALYRKGMSLALSDRYKEAQVVFHELTKVEASSFDADEYASQMAAIYLLNPPDETEKQLYAARNLFDGGYYEESVGKLQPLIAREGELNENQKAELYYRLGRNFHAQDSLVQAGEAYAACIARKPGRALWMKVYAHYYLGRLAETAGEFEQARTWYKQALSYSDYPYQSGLEQRCKAAIHQLRSRKKSSG